MASTGGISAHYLGWLPTSGTQGDQFVDPMLRDLLDRGLRLSAHRKLRRHWLQLLEGNLCISEFSPRDSAAHRQRNGSDATPRDGAESCSYTAIPLTDIGYIKIDSFDRLAFGVILIGYNEESTCSTHVHAWRGNSSGDVANFMAQLAASIQAELQSEQYSSCLHQPVLQQVQAASAAPAAKSDIESLGSMAHSLALELRQRLDTGGATPLLHPPKDYDTLNRSHGNPRIRQSVQQLGESTQAPNGAYIRRPFVMTAAEEEKSLLQQESPWGRQYPRSPPDSLDLPAAHSRASGDRQQPHQTGIPSQHYQHQPASNSPNSGQFEVPPPDYDTGGSSRNYNRSVSGGTTSNSASPGEDQRWSDPWLGFSTWRWRKGSRQPIQANSYQGYQQY